MKALRHFALLGIPTLLCASLAACGGGGSTNGGSSTPASYSVGGTAGGFTGMLKLLDNGSESDSLTQPGSFAFSQMYPSGSAYAVSVGVYPPAQTCTVSNGTGTVNAANVTNIGVSCTIGTIKTLFGGIRHPFVTSPCSASRRCCAARWPPAAAAAEAAASARPRSASAARLPASPACSSCSTTAATA